MTYKLKFLPSAKKEWDKLDNSVKIQFKGKLKKCLVNPHIQSNKLRGFDNAYKIKLRSAGYRLVYEVDDLDVIVFVIAIGKRENNAAYDKARDRTKT
ncbi:MAG: type II toxin-antitoxin system mRNA interferase toxin, RelE/StbE family [Methylobacter sp.]|nr:MAG: type II toxin-antitoxin system mRNA interferase toxin, RelE/StbE family [Methylobacter sp.]PPD22178.1 MAG: type II toxin-antitoxin system mRNA interferase toxin, RelE/StbE family [Methylobacter sp.]PPD34858.1 MAG: type II toxin-antitoxin system mRNA interferase toxin, RelE/StbE family [Methylomonas sp.]